MALRKRASAQLRNQNIKSADSSKTQSGRNCFPSALNDSILDLEYIKHNQSNHYKLPQKGFLSVRRFIVLFVVCSLTRIQILPGICTVLPYKSNPNSPRRQSR
jgi:hypothetical protein